MPGKHSRGNFDMHLDIWIREVEMEIIFKRYWLRVRELFLERVSGKNMG